MGIDTLFFSRLLGWYAFMLCFLGIQSALDGFPYLTIFSFAIAAVVGLAAFAAKRIRYTYAFRCIVIAISLFLFLIIFICTTYGVNQGFTNFWSFMACNIVICTFGSHF